MKVAELIEKLKNMPQDSEVRLARPTFDRWGVVIAVTPRSVYEETVEWSGYHEEFRLPREDVDRDRERDHEAKTLDVVVLR